MLELPDAVDELDELELDESDPVFAGEEPEVELPEEDELDPDLPVPLLVPAVVDFFFAPLARESVR